MCEREPPHLKACSCDSETQVHFNNLTNTNEKVSPRHTAHMFYLCILTFPSRSSCQSRRKREGRQQQSLPAQEAAVRTVWRLKLDLIHFSQNCMFSTLGERKLFSSFQLCSSATCGAIHHFACQGCSFNSYNGSLTEKINQ